ncbi:acetyl esterase/lipase [Mesorhizobium sp. J18]|uniref:alpha/beta hydrolase n=1 Tax=Mesorhizobium sp. J18 TaxID=935263 RepID=UPI0011998CDF|nr:alpha/beta hydrolase [Mesorhizobium sp. J18]TWG92484.1 acetyl esterase/lipase [Mesorhizobium sp. J18]
MIHRQVSDWDDAYANGINIPQGERWPSAWAEPSRAYRERLIATGRAEIDIAYGERPRNCFDLFLPVGAPKGLVVYVHGGFWMRLDKSLWSHLAAGAVERGYAVAMPGYTLCPDIRISGITAEIGSAIETVAARIGGPIFLTGHSAGGHLATRMICASSPLSQPVRDRIVNTVSISGVHDLRPLMRTAMNATLGLAEEEARVESPALLEPLPNARLTCWVGAGERAEFIRQNALLANIWIGLGASIAVVEEPDRHHFNVIDGLADPDHPLTRTLLTG